MANYSVLRPLSFIYNGAWLLLLLTIATMLLAFNLLLSPLVATTTNTLQEQAARSTLDRVYTLIESHAEKIKDYRATQIAAHKQRVQDVVRVAEWHFKTRYNDSQKGLLSEEQARHQVLSELRQLRFGVHEDYAWVSDLKSFLVSHPEYHEQDFSERLDDNGVLIVPPMVKKALADGEGFHEYWWTRLGDTQSEKKIAYFRLFEPWDLVIGSGVYTSDIEVAVAGQKTELISNLREIVSAIKIEKTGYLFIFDQTGKAIAHPNREGTNLRTLKPKGHSESLFQEFKDIADSEEAFPYLWDRPDDKGNLDYEKRAWVRRFNNGDFDWYIGASVYVEELTASASILSFRIAQISVVVIIIVALALFVHIWRLKSRLIDLSALRQEFLEISSHDMGNQLATLRLYVRILIARLGWDKPAKRQLEVIDDLALDVQRMIRGISTREALETGQLKLSVTPTDPSELLKHHVQLKLAYAARKSIELVTEAPENCPDVSIDYKRVGDVIGNLIDNAIKFGSAGDRVITRLAFPDRRLRIEVEDQGPGISDEDLRSVFSKYVRLSNRPTAGEKSSGLGLYICKLIVDLHGGTIGVHNNEGPGCTFWFEVPDIAAKQESAGEYHFKYGPQFGS